MNATQIVDRIRLHQDANLAAGLDGEGPLNAIERCGDRLERFQALDVQVDAFTARARAPAGDRIHCLY